MTTSPVVSVTDELVAELEALYLSGWEASGEGWNAEYPGDAHETKAFTDLMRESCGPVIAKLLSERAELKRDAERYRWLIKHSTYGINCRQRPELTIPIFAPDHSGGLDTAIDAAMQSEAKP